MVRGVWKTVIRDVDRLYTEGTSAGWSDDQLLARFLTARDESDTAFEVIVRRHGPMVLEVCRGWLGNCEDAQDAFQATFLVLARRAGSLAPHPCGSLGPWLHQVACRTAQKARVARARRQARERRAAARAESIAEGEGSTAFDPDAYRILHEEVARLPEKYRAAIVLCYFEGLTHDQAATSLRWPVGTVHGYLARARDLLRTRLVRRGVAPALAIGVLDSGLSSTAATLAPSLVEGTLRAIAKGSAASTVAALSGSIVRSLAIARARRMLFALTLLALGVGGAGLTAWRLSGFAVSDDPPQRASVPAAQLAPRSVAANGVDVYGDPLPDGATARMGTVRFNHGSLVESVTFSPDGSLLASLGSDHFIRIWHPLTGRELRRLGNGVDYLYGITFSPDGKTLAAGVLSDVGQVILFDTTTGQEIRHSDLLDGNTSAITFAPDGRTIATGSAGSGQAVLLDTRSLKPLRRIEAHRRDTSAVAFTPDGKTLVTGGNDMAPKPVGGERETGSVAFFDVATGDERKRLPIKEGYVIGLAMSRDGRRLAVGVTDDSIRVLDLPTGQVVRTLRTPGKIPRNLMTDGGVKCLRFSPDGKLLASGVQAPMESTQHYVRVPTQGRAGPSQPAVGVDEFEPYSVTLWDVTTGQAIRHIPAHIQWVADLAFSPDGKTLASCGAETVIRLWDTASGREPHGSDAHHSAIRSMAIAPDGRRLVTGGYDGTIREWDLATGREHRLIGRCASVVEDLAFTTDGKSLITGSYDETCRLWDLASGKESRRYDVIQGWISYVAISPDRRRFYAAMRIFDLASGRLSTSFLDSEGKELPTSGYVPGLFTPDGAGVLIQTREGVQLHDVSTGRLLGLVAQPPQSNYRIALSPDGRLLATGGGTGLGDPHVALDYPIHLWELASGQEVAQLGSHFGPDRSPAPRTPSRRGSHSGVRYTDALAFSHNSRWLATGRARPEQPDGACTLRLWDLAALVPRHRFQGHRNAIQDIAFSPDDRRLVSGSEDATVLIWDTAKLARPAPAGSSRSLDMDQAWSDLSGADAARAYQAIGALSANADRVVPFLAERLKPIEPDDPAKDTSPGPFASGETLRRLRAIAVLEKIGTLEVRRVLERLATGLDGARETRDARAALRRIDAK